MRVLFGARGLFCLVVVAIITEAKTPQSRNFKSNVSWVVSVISGPRHVFSSCVLEHDDEALCGLCCGSQVSFGPI